MLVSSFPTLHNTTNRLQADTVLIQTRVSVVKETPGQVSSDPEALGCFVDSLCVRIASLDNMLPGSGFALHSHMTRWEKPLAAARRGMLGGQKCRVQ